MTAARAENSSHIEPLPSLRSHEAMATRTVTAATIETALENLVSLGMILIGPETRGIDMNRSDTAAEIRSGHSTDS